MLASIKQEKSNNSVRAVRTTIVIDAGLLGRLKRLTRSKANDNLHFLTVSQLVRVGMRYWIAAGAPMQGTPEPAER